MSKTINYEGILSYVDRDGVVHQLFPRVRTDKALAESGIPADAAAVGAELKKCFQSVSDGKALVASAITDKRVPTDATATFAQMAENILKIVLGSGNATAGDVLAGKTFTNDDGVEYTGTMRNLTNGTYPKCGHEAISAVPHPDDPNNQALITFPYHASYASYSKGYIDETTVFTGNVSGLSASNIKAGVRVGRAYNHGADDTNSILGTFTSDATATAAMLTQGYTAWVNGVKITGTRPAPVKSLSGSFEIWVSSSNLKQEQVITFSTPFDTVPTVTLSATSDESQLSPNDWSLVSVSKTNFKVTTNGNNGKYGSLTFTWVAEA